VSGDPGTSSATHCPRLEPGGGGRGGGRGRPRRRGPRRSRCGCAAPWSGRCTRRGPAHGRPREGRGAPDDRRPAQGDPRGHTAPHGAGGDRSTA
jgi:hypothetical protein